MRALLLLSGVLLLAGCEGASSTASLRMPAPCTIKGQDCWKVVSLLDKTKRMFPKMDEPDTSIPTRQAVVQYYNPDLEAWGIYVVAGELFQDGGSTVYMLKDGVYIHTNRSLGNNPRYGFVTVQFKEGPEYVFNASGKLIEFKPEHE